MRRAPLGRVRQQRHPRPGSQEQARQLRGRDGNVAKLLHIRFGDDAAIGHEQHALLPEARVLHLHHHATGSRGGFRRHLDDLKKRAQHAARTLVGAGDKSIRLVHGDHHRAVIIGVEHRLPRLLGLHALDPPQELIALDERLQVFTLLRVDDPHPFQRHIQLRRRLLDFGAVPQQNRRAQPQGMILPGGLQHARLGSFRKHHSFGVPLQFFNDGRNKMHGAELRSPGPPLKL